MTVRRYRSVEEMPAPWREPNDPGNLRAVAMMLALYRSFKPEATVPGVRRFSSIQEANAERADYYRSEPPARQDERP